MKTPQVSDLTVGSSAAIFGISASSWQAISQSMSLLMMFLNLVLALGGIYILTKRIRKMRKEK